MELTLTALFFFLFGALSVLFAQAFWLQHKLKTGKVAHLGGKLVVMYTSEFRGQLKAITDLRIVGEVLREELDEYRSNAVVPEVEKKVRKPRASKKKVTEEL